ncbi:MAG: hypothetical protein JO297_04690 [Nitrososphaeraceae archaeon]|nr:hypothetical protein [Nitrososphaeraceae archaeon]
MATNTSFFPVRNLVQTEKNILSSSPTSSLFGSPTSSSEIRDARADVKPIQIYRTKIIPEIKDYYDILSARVQKVNDRLIFSMDLAGDANKNEKYETAYIWLLYYNTSNTGRSSPGHEQRIYTLIVPNFAPDSNFPLKGWYMVVFNNTANRYVLPLARISDMPKDKVQVFIDPSLIGNPSSFNYMTCVMVRVNSTFLNKAPDYLMDSAPDNDRFWREWFTR